MKDEYLKELKEKLSNFNIPLNEMANILIDYSDKIDKAYAKKRNEELIYKMIGTPNDVINNLREELNKGENYIYNNSNNTEIKNQVFAKKIIALMPFFSLIVFFILGMAFDLWHPGWLVFLSIPITSIIFKYIEDDSTNVLLALSPMLAVIVFFILGYEFGLWHPGWLVFLIIPIIGIISGFKSMSLISFLTSISVFVSLIMFILLGIYTNDWDIYWLVLLSIPMIGIFYESKTWKIVLMELGFIIAIISYLYLGYLEVSWGYTLIPFILPIVISIILGDDSYIIMNRDNRRPWIMFLSLLIIYIVFGILYSNTWGFLWMIFLLIPIYQIIKNTSSETRIIAIMPFVSTIIFFSLGYFANLWTYSWLAFLLTPMISIIIRKH